MANNKIPKSRYIIKYRFIFLLLIILITLFFFYHLLKLGVATDFSHTLPQKHPYVKMHNKFRDDFGGANKLQIIISTKKGTIFNKDTLTKISYITDALLGIDGVDRYKILSIASPKVKDIHLTLEGQIIRDPLMWPDPATEKDDIEKLEKKIVSSDMLYGVLVSVDKKSALITSDLYEWKIDYPYIYKSITEIVESNRDENNSIEVIGNPIIIGRIREAVPRVVLLFVGTLAVMICILFIYFRSLRVCILPITISFINVIWCLGFAHFLGYYIDPCIIGVPFLVMALSIGHGTQLLTRYVEIYPKEKDNKSAAEKAITLIATPGLSSLATDALGFFSLILIPIKMLQELAICTSFGLISIIITNLILLPVILSYSLFFLKGISEEAMEKRATGRFFYWLSTFSTKKNSYPILFCTLLLVLGGLYISKKVIVGDVNPGSPIFWENSSYNLASKEISEKFGGTDILMVVFEGEESASGEVMIQSNGLKYLEAYANYMSLDPKVGGTESIVDTLKTINMIYHDNDFKWALIPPSKTEVACLYELFTGGGDPGDIERFVINNYNCAAVRLYCADHMGVTIKQLLDRTKEFINLNPGMKKDKILLRMAGGEIGVFGAVNEVISKSQVSNIIQMTLAILIFCTLSYHSFIAGLLLLIPVITGCILTFAFMVLTNIELNFNTLPVAALGLGIGIDYGLYLTSRVIDELKLHRDINIAIEKGITTTGRAVLFTAITLFAGVFLWIFSDLKMQANMGILLGFMFLTNMVLTLLCLPALFSLIKPKFLQKYEKGGEELSE